MRAYEGAATLLHGMDSFTHPDLMADSGGGSHFKKKKKKKKKKKNPPCIHCIRLEGREGRHHGAWRQLQATVELLLL